MGSEETIRILYGLVITDDFDRVERLVPRVFSTQKDAEEWALSLHRTQTHYKIIAMTDETRPAATDAQRKALENPDESYFSLVNGYPHNKEVDAAILRIQNDGLSTTDRQCLAAIRTICNYAIDMRSTISALAAPSENRGDGGEALKYLDWVIINLRGMLPKATMGPIERRLMFVRASLTAPRPDVKEGG